MSLSTIIQRIEADADGARQKILAQAEAEADRLRAEARQAAEQEADAIRQRADDDLESFRQKHMAAAQLQARNRRADNRQRLLNDVRDRALERVLDCDDEQFAAMMTGILLSINEDQAAEVVPADADRDRLSQAFLDDVNARLKQQQRALRYAPASRTAPIARGCVIDFQDFDINVSFENLLAGLWEQTKHEVSAQLFGNGNH